MKKLKEEVLLKKFSGNKVPLIAFIELTNNCDLNCIHCFRTKKPVFNLPEKLLKELLSQLSVLGTLNVTFTGGEPFLYKGLFESVSYARRKGLNVKISTSGTAIKKTDIRSLKSLAPITIQASIYGSTAAIHDAITRTNGSYRKTLSTLKLLSSAGISVKTNMIVMKKNFFQLERAKKMAHREGWAFSSDFIIYPGDNGSNGPLQNRITNIQIKTAYAKKLIENKNFVETPGQNDIINCKRDLATISCRISPRGKVFPSGTSRLEIGDLKKSGFRDIWFGSRQADSLRNLKYSDFECSACGSFRKCLWDTGLALAEHGSITATPKEWCRFIKKGVL